MLAMAVHLFVVHPGLIDPVHLVVILLGLHTPIDPVDVPGPIHHTPTQFRAPFPHFLPVWTVFAQL